MSGKRVEVAATAATKTYPDTPSCARALAHYRLFQHLPGWFTIPELLDATATQLTFRALQGNAARPEDLTAIASGLGHLHRAAHDRHLTSAPMNTPAQIDGTLIPAFGDPQRHRKLLAQIHHSSATLLTTQSVDSLFAAAATWPAAVYKDCNPRNFIVAPKHGPVALIDFDDLTLAPFGYDLAKLIVTTAMTHGPAIPGAIDAALSAYNRPLNADQQCPPPRLAGLCEVHHLLTAPYLGRNGYRHPWPGIRPWTNLEDPW